MNTFLKHMIMDKRIILWGTGNTAQQFYDKYKEKLPIAACTGNDRDIVPIGSLKAVRPCDLNRETDFIIVCSIYYDEIRYQLMCSGGYEPYSNFIKYNIFGELYEAEEKQKKLIVAVGQCEINEICKVLNMLDSFKKKYALCYFDEQKVCMHGSRHNLEETKECLKLLRMADYFIKPSAISPQLMKNFSFLQEHMNDSGKVITVSLFNMDSYWAQDIFAERTINKYYMTKNGLKLSAYVERDRVIEKLLDEGYTTKEILHLICKEDFFEPDEILKNHRNCMKRAQIADRISDIKMADFVAENYRLVKLYCDRGHFNEKLLREYVRRIIELLGESESQKELAEKKIGIITQHVNELPIYPSAARILDLQWVDHNTLYRQKLYNGIRLVTFVEYMEWFINYCQCAREVLKYCFWPSDSQEDQN